MEGIGDIADHQSHSEQLLDSVDSPTAISTQGRSSSGGGSNGNCIGGGGRRGGGISGGDGERGRGGGIRYHEGGSSGGGEVMSGSSASQSPDIACARIPLELFAAGALGSVKEERDLAAAEDLSSSQEPPAGRPNARESLSVIVPPQDVDVDSRDSELLSPGKLSPTSGISVSVASMIDATDFRAMQPEPTYQTLTSVAERMSPPGFSPGSSYATLTPLQPLPPISTMSDKFVYGGHAGSGVTGSFAVMQNNGLGNISLGGMGGSPYAYDKLASMGMSPPHNYPSPGGGLQPSPLSPQSAYSQSALNSPHKSASPHYEPAFLPRLQQSPAALSPPSPPVSAAASFAPSHHSPNALSGPASPPPMQTQLQQQQQQQQQQAIQQQTISHTQHVQHTSVVMKTVSSAGNGAGEVEEINTKELAQRISAELKRYSIPQAIFAQRVLCRSQGTLSDLLRNPKPWSKLKSGRETFRRMWKWLQEPEFQRMSALRLAG